MEREQKRREDKKDAHYYFFELMKAREELDKAYADVKQAGSQYPDVKKVVDRRREKVDQLVQALSWWLFKNL